MLSSTWTERALRIEYTDASGKGCTASDVLADFYPAGAVFVLNGAKTLISWERICLLELIEEV